MSRDQSNSSKTRKDTRRAVVERLQERVLMSATPDILHTDFVIGHREANPVVHTKSMNHNDATPTGYSPAQVRQAYGINQIRFGSVVGNGAGQTIAIVDAYNDPRIAADLATFDRAFGLPGPASFRVLNQNGGTSLPGLDPNAGPSGSWAGEISLDVEWAHAVAPSANIVLFEANSSSNNDLYAAVNSARHMSGVSVVSMSFGGAEQSGDKAFDSTFTTPAGHTGVTFLASTGDNGAFEGFNNTIGVQYPAACPNVVAVGGTSLFNNGGNYSESAWNKSGGGISTIYGEPGYQQSADSISNGHRGVVDVSFLADPNTGVSIVDSQDLGSASPWMTIGGTSLSCPAWAGLMAITNQGRALSGKATLDGPTQTLPAIYNLPSSDFHDVTSGNNGHYSARGGYDLVTGRGRPRADLLVAGLSGNVSPTPTPTPTPTPSSKGSIAGSVFWDLQRDGVYHGSYEGLGGWSVVIDANHDGVFGKGDFYTTTNSFGGYAFTNVPLGTYKIGLYFGDGSIWYATTSPIRTVSVSAAHPNVGGQNFGVNDWANYFTPHAAATVTASTAGQDQKALLDGLFSDQAIV